MRGETLPERRFADPFIEHVMRGIPVTRVGNAVYHTVGDREQAVKQLAVDMTTTFVELAAQIGVVPYAGSAERVKANPVWYAWWTSTAAPMFKAWNEFHQAQIGNLDAPGWISDYVAYAQRWETDWPVYVQWRARLSALRAGARSIGLRLVSAEPSDLPTTLPEDAADLARYLAHKAEHAADDAYDFMKIAAYGVLGLGALVGVTVIANAAKGKSVKGLYR